MNTALQILYNTEEKLRSTVREASGRMGAALNDKVAHDIEIAQRDLNNVRERIRQLEGKPPYGKAPMLP